MCIKAADFPSPIGESDLKGNPKLSPYCGCFAKAFMARALKASDGSNPGTLAVQNAQELAMRSGCRKQFGLPPVPPEPGAKK